MPQKRMLLPQLNIAGMAIAPVSNFNFHGIKIDTNLNWLSHANFVANKILQTAGVLNKLRDILPQSVLTAIYFPLIQCHFNYGVLAWGHQSNGLFKLQKRILRIITCSQYDSHTAPHPSLLSINRYLFVITQPVLPWPRRLTRLVFLTLSSVFYLWCHFFLIDNKHIA